MLVSSFVEMGGILRFDSHLIDTETGQLVAAVSVSGSKDDYADLVGKLAGQVAAALSVPVPATHDQARQAEAPTESWEAYTYLERCLHYHTLGRPQQALEEVLRCLYLEPNCEMALTLTMALAGGLRKVDFAVDLAERVIGKYSSDPDKPWLAGDAYSSMVFAYLRLDQPENALAVIKRGLAADIPDTYKMYLLIFKVRCLRALDRDDPEVLVGIYRQVIDYPTDEEHSHHSRWLAAVEAAAILTQQKDNDEAISILLGAAGGPPEPNYSGAQRFLEIVEDLLDYSLEKGDLESGAKLVAAAVHKYPTATAATGWAHLQQAQLYEAEGKLDEAIQSYSTVAELRDWHSFFKVMLKIGDLHLQKGEVEEAASAYQRVVRCAGGSRHGDVRGPARLARERLKELGMPESRPEGYQPNLILTQQHNQATMILGDNGYVLDRLSVLPLDNLSEALSPYQIVLTEWPKGGQPWWVTQSWLNFVRRGGGLALLMLQYVRRSAGGPIRASLGIDPTPDARVSSVGGRSLTARQHHPAAQAIDNMLVGCICPFQADQGIVLATWHDLPMLAAVERGLGRVLVAGFPLSRIGREYAQSHMDAAERANWQDQPAPEESGCGRRKPRGKEANS